MYKLRGNCVVKSDTGEVVKCHDSKDAATAHLRALYANVPDAKKEAGEPMEIEKEVSATPSENYAHGTGGLMSQPGEGKTETPESKKKKKRVDLAGVFNAMLSPKEFASSMELTEKDFGYAAQEAWHIQSLLQAMSIMAGLMHDEAAGGEVENVKTLNEIMDKLAAYMQEQKGELLQAAQEGTYESKETETPHWDKETLHALSSFAIEKDANGKLRWVLFSGSAFQDRDMEIIATKAFERDCDEMDITGDYGELLWWHCDGELHANEKEARPYLPLGQCDISLVDNKINIESGTFYDEQVGQILLDRADSLGASKAFYHAENEPVDGVYYQIRTKERSLMPRARESNLLTRLFNGSKEKEMANSQERVDALKKKIGKEKTEEILELAKEMSERANAVLASKEAKKKKKDEEAGEADDAGDEEDEKMKEFTVALATEKERGDKLTADLKAQAEKAVETEKAMNALNERIAKAERLVAALYGVQPKGNGFSASTAKETEITPDAEIEKLVRDSEKAAALMGDPAAAGNDWMGNLSNFVITGQRQ